VISARVASEVDFCCFAVLMAARNEASICGSSTSVVMRNTPRSRCISAHHQRSPDVPASFSASFIVSSASEVRSAKCKKGVKYLTCPSSVSVPLPSHWPENQGPERRLRKIQDLPGGSVQPCNPRTDPIGHRERGRRHK
jgi:hypothetical protein